MSREQDNTILDFQQELMDDLKKRYSKTNKRLTPNEINKYIFMFSDILLYGGTKRSKTKKIKNIKILGSREFLFKSKKQKNRARIYVNNYSSILIKYIEGVGLYGGDEPHEAKIMIPDNATASHARTQINSIRGKERKGEKEEEQNCQNHSLDAMEILMNKLKQSSKSHSTGSVLKLWNLEKSGIDKVISMKKEMEARVESKVKHYAMDSLPEQYQLLAKGVMDSADTGLTTEISTLEKNAINIGAKDGVTDISAILFSILTEAADAATEFIGGFFPIEPVLSEIEAVAICDPGKSVVLIELLWPTIPLKIGGTELKINLYLATLSNAMCEGCGGPELIGPEKTVNKSVRNVIKIACKSLIKSTSKIFEIKARATEYHNRLADFHRKLPTIAGTHEALAASAIASAQAVSINIANNAHQLASKAHERAGYKHQNTLDRLKKKTGYSQRQAEGHTAAVKFHAAKVKFHTTSAAAAAAAGGGRRRTLTVTEVK